MTRTSCAWARVGLGRKLYFCRCSRGSPLVAASSHTTRRFLSSKPPGAPKEPEIAATIPGPSWLWLDPIVEPFRAYGRVQRRRPYTTQFVSSLVIYFVGDLVAQSIADPVSSSGTGEEAGQEQKGWVQEWSNNRDWHRTGRSILIGGISSIPAYKWFLFLGNNFNYASKIWSLTVKVGHHRHTSPRQ
jgi:protein Mpv17